MRKITKILVFPVVTAIAFVALNMSMKIPLFKGEAYHNRVSELKSKFHQAVQQKDLAQAKESYLSLKELLPEHDHFIDDIASAYIADLYIVYAQQLAYNQKAASLMLAKAQEYAPNHPALQQASTEIAQIQERLASMDVKSAQFEKAWGEEQLKLLNAPPLPSAVPEEPALAAMEKEAVEPALGTEASLEALDEELKAVQAASLTDDDALLAPDDHMPGLAQASQPLSIPDLHDACSLAYYTRKSSLVSCIDPVDERRYGPALFVVGETRHPILAFSQQPVTQDEYNVFCAISKDCYDDAATLGAWPAQVNSAGVALDVSDVEQTVDDYNAYCKMSNSCSAIKGTTQKVPELSKGQLQRYALWLTKITGHRYRVTTADDVTKILAYIETCVNTNSCQPALLDQAQKALQHKEKYVTRVTDRVG